MRSYFQSVACIFDSLTLTCTHCIFSWCDIRDVAKIARAWVSVYLQFIYCCQRVQIFSKLLLEDPVDYSLEYFTGDSKGVTTSGIENASGKLFASSAVVTLRKIFVILSESAVIEDDKVVKFNNPNLIFNKIKKNAYDINVYR